MPFASPTTIHLRASNQACQNRISHQMDGFGIRFVHKAQILAIRRWFTKQASGPNQTENASELERGGAELQIEGHEETRRDHGVNRSGPEHQKVRIDVANARPTDLASGDAAPLEESENTQPATTPDETLCDGMDFGEDILVGEVDANEFTETGGGIVCGFDGAKKCPVLLLRYDMSVQIQKMLLFQRAVVKQEREAQAKLEALDNYETALTREIQNHQALIGKAAESGGESDMTEAAQEPNRGENLENELENLERLFKGADNRKAVVENNVTRRRKLLQRYQEDVNKHLEVAFVYAQAIEEASDQGDVDVPEISIQEEYQSLLIQMENLHGGPLVERLPTAGNELVLREPSAPSPEQHPRVLASKALWEADQELQWARVQFDERNARRERELQQNIAADQRGEPISFSSVEEFDLIWVIRFRELTRAVVDAEEGLSRARAAAKEAGVKLEHDTQSSCFPDDVKDGQPELMSSENDSPETFAGDPRMIAWMDSLDDSIDPEFSEPADVDEWGIGEEVVSSDSASVVAYGSERRRIDAWQRTSTQ